MVNSIDSRLELTTMVVAQTIAEHEWQTQELASLAYQVRRVTQGMLLEFEVRIFGAKSEEFEESIEIPADPISLCKVWLDQQKSWWARSLNWFVRRYCKKPSMIRYKFTAEGKLLFPYIGKGFANHNMRVLHCETRVRKESEE